MKQFKKKKAGSPTLPRDEISLSLWRRIYAAIERYLAYKPWLFMTDNMVFGVRSSSGADLYCIVLGNAGVDFSFIVFRGARGFEGYRRIFTEREDIDHSLAQETDYIMLSFENARAIPAQKKLMKDLGFSFPGLKGYPTLTEVEPGLATWPVADTASLLSAAEALEQALVVCERAQKDRGYFALLNVTRHEKIPTRSAEVKKDNEVVWHDELLPAPIFHGLWGEQSFVIDEVAVKRLKKMNLPRSGTWEIDYHFSPGLIQSDPNIRPYAPVGVVICDADTAMVPKLELIDREEELFSMMFSVLVQTAEEVKRMPAVLKYRRKDLSPLMRRIGDVLEVKIVQETRLPTVLSLINAFYKEM